jgi:molybdate transport system substrate-binding protein
MSAVRRGLAAALIATVLAGCSAPGTTSPTPAGTTVTVFAAASLKAALTAISAAYATVHPDVSVVVSIDASAALAAKIGQGAPADVFLSADTAHPQRLVDAGLATGPVVPFARNALAVIVPAANPAGIGGPEDLARPGVKVVAAADGVPISTYAAALLANLAATPGYPADFAARVDANVVSREDSVAGVVTKVSLAEGDAGIAYATDAAAAGARLTTVPIPAGANVVATYGGVVLTASAVPEAAQAFLAWLAGPDGQAVLAGLGFGAPA